MKKDVHNHTENCADTCAGLAGKTSAVSCGCSSCVSRTEVAEGGEGNSKNLIRIGIGGVFFAAGIAVRAAGGKPDTGILFYIGWTLFFISYLVTGYEVVVSAVRNILKGRVFDENFLMALASIGAFAIGEYPEAAAVMLFYQVGETFQNYAVGRSRKSIAALSAIRPDHASVLRDGRAISVRPDAVQIGELIEVRAGERIPLDGVVAEGEALLDTSALTGESVPRRVRKGMEALSGSICTDSLLRIRVLRSYGESAVARILELAETSAGKKARSERFITRFARVYTPVVTIAAFLLAVVPPLLMQGSAWSMWIERALTFLVVSCPCALVISVPLGFFGGIGAASRRGVLVKGSGTLEALSRAEIAVFDKTGTLTEGVFSVRAVHPSAGGRLTESELVALAAHAEKYSGHPVSVSLRQYHQEECCGKVSVTDFKEISGKGISAFVNGKQALAGNIRLLESFGVTGLDATESGKTPAECAASDGGTVIHVASDGVYTGHIVIADKIKEGSLAAVPLLKHCGVKEVVMLTGDSRAAAERAAKELAVDRVYAELLPGDKVSRVEEMISGLEKEGKRRGTLVFAGDGINDAPVLARADVGIAMGSAGSDAAIEASDAVIMTDDLTRLAEAILIGKRTSRVVTANIVFALGIKMIVLTLGAFGLTSLWAAVFADVGVSVLAVLNSLRMLHIPKSIKNMSAVR